MTLKDALDKRNMHQDQVIGLEIKGTGRKIRHVLVSPRSEISKIISSVVMDEVSNETALRQIDQSRDDFDVFVLNDEGSWGDNVQFYTTLDDFLKNRMP